MKKFGETRNQETTEYAQKNYPAMRELTGQYYMREITLKQAFVIARQSGPAFAGPFFAGSSSTLKLSLLTCGLLLRRKTTELIATGQTLAVVGHCDRINNRPRDLVVSRRTGPRSLEIPCAH